MKVKKLHLQNYGRFDELQMEFAPSDEIKGNVTIIVGNNGAGKSQVLQALATGFSWFVNGVKNNSNGFEIDKKLIKNNTNETCVHLEVDLDYYNDESDISALIGEKNTSWQISSVKNGREPTFSNKILSLLKAVNKYRRSLTQNNLLSLPLIVFYPVERSIIINSQADTLTREFDQLDAYFACVDGVGIDFYDFFKWFKELEDIENANIVNEIRKKRNDDYASLLNTFKEFSELFEELSQQIKEEKDEGTLELLRESRADLIEQMARMEKEISKGFQSKIDTIQSECINIDAKTVKSAIELFTDFKNIRIERQGTPKMVVEKDGEKLDVNQLSQGEKSLLALVGDIARRLAILNPNLANPLHGKGVVLIDEVDLHLHPKWQQDLIDKLTETFPNVQFILTTHSPHIVSDNPDVLVYILDNGELRQYRNSYGEDANTLLNGVFGVSEFTPEIAEQFTEIRRAISHKELDKAEDIIQKLSNQLSPNNSELLRLQLYLAKAKLIQNKVS